MEEPLATEAAPVCRRLESACDLFVDEPRVAIDDLFYDALTPSEIGEPVSRVEISAPPVPDVVRSDGLDRLLWLPISAKPAAEPRMSDLRRLKLNAPRTTVTLRHLPRGIDEAGVCCILDHLGFQFLYDAVYVADTSGEAWRQGDVIINFLRCAHAEACVRMCTGCRFFGGPSCVATFSRCQGSDFVTMCMSEHMRKCEIARRQPLCPGLV